MRFAAPVLPSCPKDRRYRSCSIFLLKKAPEKFSVTLMGKRFWDICHISACTKMFSTWTIYMFRRSSAAGGSEQPSAGSMRLMSARKREWRSGAMPGTKSPRLRRWRAALRREGVRSCFPERIYSAPDRGVLSRLYTAAAHIVFLLLYIGERCTCPPRGACGCGRGGQASSARVIFIAFGAVCGGKMLIIRWNFAS